MSLVTVGRLASIHSRNSDVGIGSSSHVLEAHFFMIVCRESLVIGSNDVNVEFSNFMSKLYSEAEFSGMTLSS